MKDGWVPSLKNIEHGGVNRVRGKMGIAANYKVLCLQENTMVLMCGSQGVVGYDIGASRNCIIPYQKIGIVEITNRHLLGQSAKPNYKKREKERESSTL